MTTKDTLSDRISAVFGEVYSGQTGGADVPPLEQDTILLDTGLDSLGFAILVTQLEEELGYDPFTLSEEAYYPQTFGEFVEFYHKNAPK